MKKLIIISLFLVFAAGVKRACAQVGRNNNSDWKVPPPIPPTIPGHVDLKILDVPLDPEIPNPLTLPPMPEPPAIDQPAPIEPQPPVLEQPIIPDVPAIPDVPSTPGIITVSKQELNLPPIPKLIPIPTP